MDSSGIHLGQGHLKHETFGHDNRIWNYSIWLSHWLVKLEGTCVEAEPQVHESRTPAREPATS